MRTRATVTRMHCQRCSKLLVRQPRRGPTGGHIYIVEEVGHDAGYDDSSGLLEFVPATKETLQRSRAATWKCPSCRLVTYTKEG